MPESNKSICTNFKLRQLDRVVTRHYDRFVSASGMKITQYSLLSHVVRLGPLRPGELARAMQMDASTLTRNLQALVAQGWVRLGSGEDARSRRVEATSAGIAKRNQAQRAWQEAQQALNLRLGSARVAALHRLIEECMDCFDEEQSAAA